MTAGRLRDFLIFVVLFIRGVKVGMGGRVAALMPFVCGMCAIRVGLVAGAVGAGVVGRAARATEATGRDDLCEATDAASCCMSAKSMC